MIYLLSLGVIILQSSKNAVTTQCANQDDNNLKDLLNVIWRRKNILGLVVVLFALPSVILNYFIIEPVYESFAVISLGNFNGSIYTDPQYASELIVSDNVLNAVARDLNIGYLSEKSIQTETVKKTKFLKIVVRNENPQMAKTIADKIIMVFSGLSEKEHDKYVDLINNQILIAKARLDEIEKDAKVAKETLALMDRSSLLSFENNFVRFRILDYLKDVELQRKTLIEGNFALNKELSLIKKVEVIKAPKVPESPFAPNKLLNVAVFGIVGLMIGMFIVFITEYLSSNKSKQIS